VCRHPLVLSCRIVLGYGLRRYGGDCGPTIALHWCNDCKQKDLALLRLRKDLGRYAPDVAARLREGVAGGKET